MTRLECENLNVSVPGRLLVEALRLDIHAGSFIAILGTNGVGKTLTLHTLAGLIQTQGSIRINGHDISALPRREMARQLGMLLQIQEDAFPMTVLENVLTGRYPHLDLLQWPDNTDRQAALDAIRFFDLDGFEDRLLDSLSGGERERVALAALKVQDPDIWLLDEPMNHLDPQHQLAVLRNLKATADSTKIVIASIHNPSLAMRFCDHALLLYGDGNWEYGPAADMLVPDRLERTYQTPFKYFTNAGEKVLVPV